MIAHEQPTHESPGRQLAVKRLDPWPRNMDINKRQAELLIGMVDNTPIQTTAVNAEAVIADLQLLLDLKAKLIAILDPKES